MQTLSGEDVRGRPVKINTFTPKRARHVDPTNRTTWRNQVSELANDNPSAYAFNRWQQYDTAERWTAPVEEGRRLYVGGLSMICGQTQVEHEIRKLFKDFHVEAVSKRVAALSGRISVPDDYYYCFVDLADAAEIGPAIACLDGTPNLHGGQYRVKSCNGMGSKIVREQYGGVSPITVEAKPTRDLSSNWRDVLPKVAEGKKERNLTGNWRRLETQEV